MKLNIHIHKLKRLWPVFLLAWPIILSSAVLVRQAKPFRVRSDDYAFYQIAKDTAAHTREAAQIHGFWAGFKAFNSGCSVFKTLPAHVFRKRPAVIWIWSGAYLIAGDRGLIWTWRALYLVMILSLALLIRRLSTPLVAALLTGIVAIAPATQGLLSWMSCSNFLICYSSLLIGAFILYSTRNPVSTVIGMMMLIIALLSREVAFVLISVAVSVWLFISGRRVIAILLPIMAVIIWLIFPIEGRTAIGTFVEDPTLFIRGALLVAAADLASIVRNLGLMVLIPITMMLCRRIRVTGLIMAACSLFLVPMQLLLPVVISVLALKSSRQSILGFLWFIFVIGSICLYGYFSSRYAFEPLLGLVLALAPALSTIKQRTLLWFVPCVFWFTVTSLGPDYVYHSSPVRRVSNITDQRLRALHMITSLREREYVTFAGRIDGGWENRDNLRISLPDDESSRGFVWASPEFLRAGSAPNLHCRIMDHVVFNQSRIWEWNVWYWRVIPEEKGRGIHVDLPGESWAVHPRGDFPTHDRCLYITPDDRPLASYSPSDAVQFWLLDTPELNNPGRARSWLRTVWDQEKGCYEDLSFSSFSRLELGKLLIRDDGWLDLLELHYLETMDGP